MPELRINISDTSTVIGKVHHCGFVPTLSSYSSVLSHTSFFSSCGSQIKASVLFVFWCTLGARINWMRLEGIEFVRHRRCPALPYLHRKLLFFLFIWATALHNSINGGSVDYQFTNFTRLAGAKPLLWRIISREMGMRMERCRNATWCIICFLPSTHTQSKKESVCVV